jgi:hypothetical protein
MSNALAIAGVTAVLRDLLDDGMIDHKVTDALGHGVTVSALAPDEIPLGGDQQPRLNLFLYQATPNAAWRNMDFPALDPVGRRIGNPPLALDLHYMLTAYGVGNLEAEVLLGYAMLLFHETPVLPRAAIRRSLDPPPSPAVPATMLPTLYQSLRASELANQIEQIKVTPEVMNTEELSKLWTAIQSHYRPTATYVATVVLIRPVVPEMAPLPVLSRGSRDPVTKRETGPAVNASLDSPYPAITSITFPPTQNSARLGDTVSVEGQSLDGTQQQLLLSNPWRGISRSVPANAGGSATALSFLIPDDPANLPAGLYAVAIQLVGGRDPAPRTTNQLALAIAPQITALPSSAALAADGTLTLTPTCTPQIQRTQDATLILGTFAVDANPITSATATPTFVFSGLVPGTYWARLRVDGVESPLVVYGTPPSFSGPQISVTP